MSDISEKEEYKLKCLGILEKQIYQAQENLKTFISQVKNDAADNEEYIFNSTEDALLKCINRINGNGASAARWLGMVVGLKMAWCILHTQELEEEKFKLLDEAKKIKAEMWERARATGNYLNEGPLLQRLDAINKRLGEIEMKEAKIRIGG